MHNTILVALLGFAVLVFYKVVSTIAIKRQNAGEYFDVLATGSQFSEMSGA